MRELKFRAWNGDSYIELNNLRGERSIYFSPYDLGAIPPEARGNAVLEQYTGLKDKNGKEIYEGDIVRYGRYLRGIIPPESRTEIVSWWSGEEEYYPCCTTSGFALPYSEDGYEVIGNIHENHELLEAKNVD